MAFGCCQKTRILKIRSGEDHHRLVEDLKVVNRVLKKVTRVNLNVPTLVGEEHTTRAVWVGLN